MICDQLLGPSPGQGQWADRLERATGPLKAMMAKRCEANAELEDLRASVALVQDLLLGGADGSSSLATSLDKCCAANGVQWGVRSTLVTVLSHFLELLTELELLGSGWGADLSDGQGVALWPLVSVASDSLASLVPFSLARNSPDDVE
jgi:hypothetical protein